MFIFMIFAGLILLAHQQPPYLLGKVANTYTCLLFQFDIYIHDFYWTYFVAHQPPSL